ncbi:alpha-ketoacid dehydrogenase subunit beta [Sporolactobacillus vineae]|uniref:alpha-ketoacid dehydrogenase subunit beta n=1 Tax=Sporolactobacillus vineae TaxID=444463 RepID=UPI000288FB1E|nr:alpha-ketoacid dehydrogenase subunit beta [Sporolactobacillus vineae]
MTQMTMIQAINNAMRIELDQDENVLVFGEDVAKNGGVFRATEGLYDAFGEDRVFDTPLAESGIGGLALGLALQNFRPVMEIQFFGFVFEAMDSIASQMARLRYRSGGVYHAPVTIRSPFGGGVKTPELHSDNLEGLFYECPGLKVVIPSNPYDAKGLLISAIRDNDPVLFLEHMKLYRSFREEVPEQAYTVEIGKAKVVREGTAVTLITYGAMVRATLKAAEQLGKEGIDAEIIDLRTISPLDTETITESVKKTGRAVVIQEAQKQAGIASHIIAEINDRALLYLDAPVGRVTSPDTIFPFAAAEDIWLPNETDIIQKTKETVAF